MMDQINGLHHITSMAGAASVNTAFFTQSLGLRRVKTTVNFDRPDVYHLYYGDEQGTPGTIMTHFPFGQIARGTRGNGEVSTVEFAVSQGALPFWQARLADHEPQLHRLFDENRLALSGPDGETLVLVEAEAQGRAPWTNGGIAQDAAILGLHNARLQVADPAPMDALLRLMGYREHARDGAITRYHLTAAHPVRNAAHLIDLEAAPNAVDAAQGAGSVHHIAFSVADRAAQLAVRSAVQEAGFTVTQVRDRNYFWAIYFRTPGGILFEVATNEPGFDVDEPREALGSSLKLPPKYEQKRAEIEAVLPPLDP